MDANMGESGVGFVQKNKLQPVYMASHVASTYVVD